MLTYWVKTQPLSEPVTLVEAQDHVRVAAGVDDTYLNSLISAARSLCESILGRAIITQTWVYARNGWPAGDEMALPGGKVLSLLGVTHKNTTGISTAFTDVIADTDSVPGRVVLGYSKTWPTSALYPVNPIQVEYTCGYGDAAGVPDTIKHAMLLLIGHWYEHREAVLTGTISKEIEFAVSALLQPERVFFHESR